MNEATRCAADWEQAYLRDLHAGGVSSVDPRLYPEERFEYYSIPAYQETGEPIVVPGREIQSQKLLIPDACLLFGKLNPRVEKVWNVRSAVPQRRLASTEWLPIVPVEKLDQDFGYFLLRSEWVMPIARGLVSGSTPSRERVEPKAFYDIAVPLPPLHEQRSIASVLLLVNRIIHKQSEVLRELIALKSAAMHELFTRGASSESQKETEIGPIPESWTVSQIDDVALRTQYGLSVRGQANGRYPILRMNCQDDGKVVFRDLQFVDLDDATFSAFRLEHGDLLFNRTNSIEHVGRTAIFEHSRQAVFASYLIRLTVDRKRCLPRYLNYYLNWPAVQTNIKKLASRAVGQANINASKLRTVTFPLPPSTDEQRDITALLDAIDRKIDLHKLKRRTLEDFFTALLHELMTGEIRVAELDLSALLSANNTTKVSAA